MHGKGVDKVLKEAHELTGNIFLVLGRDGAGREARVDGLLNPEHIGEMVPPPWVRNGSIRAVLPQEGAVFLDEAFERRAAWLCVVYRESASERGGKNTTTYAAVEPNDNLLVGVGVRGRLEPKVELVRAVQVLRDGHLAGIRLANVKVDIGNGRSVDSVF